MIVVSTAAMTTGIVMRVHRRGRFGIQPPKWMLILFCINLEAKYRSYQVMTFALSTFILDKLSSSSLPAVKQTSNKSSKQKVLKRQKLNKHSFSASENNLKYHRTSA